MCLFWSRVLHCFNSCTAGIIYGPISSRCMGVASIWNYNVSCSAFYCVYMISVAVAWWEGSCWGGTRDNGAPLPPVMLFCLLVWDAYYVVGTTCNDRRSLHNTFGWMGATGPPPPSNLWSEGPKNLHFTVPKSGSNIAQQYVDGYAFFHVH